MDSPSAIGVVPLGGLRGVVHHFPGPLDKSLCLGEKGVSSSGKEKLKLKN
jgi:hypothetical protein